MPDTPDISTTVDALWRSLLDSEDVVWRPPPVTRRIRVAPYTGTHGRLS